MPSSQLKRAEKGLAMMRENRESPSGVPDTIEELVGAIRALERRLAMLEDKGHKTPAQNLD